MPTNKRPQHLQDHIDIARYSAPVNTEEGCFLCANHKTVPDALFVAECKELGCLVSISGSCRHYRYDPEHISS